MNTPAEITSNWSNCSTCQSIRLTIKPNVDEKPVLLHSAKNQALYDILYELCERYPHIWRRDAQYHFYIEIGGLYHTIDDPTWLRDKDVLIVTLTETLEELPSVNLNAVHASLRKKIELRPHQIEGVNKMIFMEKAYRGGILADEMGLGKTVQTLMVILRQQPVLNIHACTLVVVPSRGIADQWAEEIRTKTTYGSLPYFIYQDDSAALIEQPCFRIVITTYDKVRSEYKREAHNRSLRQGRLEDAPLFSVEWHRVVLDESHKVRANTMLYSSVKALQAKFRWCLSGTPFQNDVTELYPIFSFLKIEMDLKKRKEDDYMKELLKTHMIRRTKSALQSELTMLPRQERRIVLEFTLPERALYDYLERLLYYQLSRIKESGDGNSLLTSSAILYLRLKQVCGHHMILLEKFPDLIPLARSGNDESLVTSLQDVDVQREKNYYDETSEFEQALEIIESYYDQFGNLQDPIDLSQLQRLKLIKNSTKVLWLANFLQTLLSEDLSDKIVVVSQFVDVITKVGEVLTNARIQCQAYHGGMSIYARKCALQKFNHDPKVRVLVMSLKAGGVGLNLQRANHMIIMDRWWNPATMDQAIARIHRMTQIKETFIHTVVIKDTIEESLMDNILNKKVSDN
ncbi:SNF2 family N-terminal domain-containing protein [Mucor mucedo]|uniref:SNF2 family N-terminal domain-containing protein n=1 Tax=Mucor mucedo TaxID=29922 RepID=UPI00221F036F|nr:SNF2 family N-terminal domain-containing protein [Mucor mucedo]KAI7891036.1 SNF2 family N-terminal domain-containing protein [Mucor mucedo]